MNEAVIPPWQEPAWDIVLETECLF